MTERCRNRWKRKAFVVCLALAVCSFPQVAAADTTSAELVKALGFNLSADPPEVLSHSLATQSQTGNPFPCECSNENALADNDERSILISNGKAEDGGLGDWDWPCGDGSGTNFPDFTQFQMKLAVPAGAMSLIFRTQFTTTEYVSTPADVKDKAYLYVTWPDDTSATIDLSNVSSICDKVSPAVLRSINVEGRESINLGFRIEDNVNGSKDSALKIMGVAFTAESTSGDYGTYAPEDVKIPAGTYRYSKQLLYVPGKGIPFDYTIYYNSRNLRTRNFFRKWTHSYEWSISKLENGQLVVKGGDGGAVYFSPRPGTSKTYDACPYGTTGSFETYREGSSGTVVIETDGTYTYTNKEMMKYRFRTDGLLDSIADPNGNTLRFYYRRFEYTSGKYTGLYLDYILDTRGGKAQFWYATDPTNYTKKMLTTLEYFDKNGRTRAFLPTTYAYVRDCFNNPVLDLTWADGLEGTTTFAYDCAGNLLTVNDPDGVVVASNTYAGELVASRADGKGAVDSFRYLDQAIEQTDRLGGIQYRHFDMQDRLVSQTDPLGDSWHYTYDEDGNLTSQTDPLGNATTMTYDDRANLLTTTDALGNTTTMTYGLHNKPLTSTDPAGYTMHYEYDGKYNLSKETNSNGHILTYTYDPGGQITTFKDYNGNEFRYTYSTAGDLTKETDPLGHIVNYEYDSLGQMTKLTDENGNHTSYIYDSPGNVTEITRPDPDNPGIDLITRKTYDAQGRVLTLEKPNGAVTSYEYSGTGKMLRLTDPIGNSFHSIYNGTDQLVGQTDPLGRTASFAHDAAGRLVEATDPSGGISRATYDAVGNRTSLTDPNGSTTFFEYDALGRVITETDPLGNTIENFYDARGLSVISFNGRGDLIWFEYDAAGRLSRSHLPTHTLRFTRDPNGNVIRIEGKDGAVVQSVFDGLDRVVSRTDPFGNTIGYEYDAAGNLITLTYSDGKAVHYEYDTLNRLRRVVDWEGNETTYTYDANGNLLSTTLPDGSLVDNTYDIADQLIAVSDTASDESVIFQANYAYNGVGLRTSADLILPLEPQIPEETATFTYDAANQITQMNGQAFSYDQDGNMTAGVVGGALKDLEYDTLSRLTRVGEDTYQYDPQGMRVQARVGGKRVRYVQDPNAPYSRLLEEQDENGNILVRYVYGLGLISRKDASGDFHVYHFDSRGSTIALTDETGQITDRYAYDPYGRVVGREGSTANPFTYNGRDGVMDDGNGLYFMRARYYEPRLMRFLQKDVAYSGNLLDAQFLNRHAYARGNPIQLVDPNGEILPILLGVGIGIATEIGFDILTGEFNPLEDDWGEYLENNWVDLTVAGVLGGAGPALSMAKKLKLLKLSKALKREKLLNMTQRCRLIKDTIKLEKLYYLVWLPLSIAEVGEDIYRAREALLGHANTAWDAVTASANEAVEAYENTAGLIEDVGESIAEGAKSTWKKIKSIF